MDVVILTITWLPALYMVAKHKSYFHFIEAWEQLGPVNLKYSYPPDSVAHEMFVNRHNMFKDYHIFSWKNMLSNVRYLYCIFEDFTEKKQYFFLNAQIGITSLKFNQFSNMFQFCNSYVILLNFIQTSMDTQFCFRYHNNITYFIKDWLGKRWTVGGYGICAINVHDVRTDSCSQRHSCFHADTERWKEKWFYFIFITDIVCEYYTHHI